MTFDSFLYLQDPYAILGVSSQSDDEEIRRAFHTLLRDDKDSEELRLAYESIRSEKNRRHYLWGNPASFVTALDIPTKEKEDSKTDLMQALVKELAFLSEWELGKESNV